MTFESLTTAELDALEASRRHPLAVAMLANRDRWFKLEKGSGVEIEWANRWDAMGVLAWRQFQQATFPGTTSEPIEVDYRSSIRDVFIRALTDDEIAAKVAEHEAEKAERRKPADYCNTCKGPCRS